MPFTFKAKIYKVGINPCVKVPLHITAHMQAEKGYIPIKGTIDGFAFLQTLVPIKNTNYRLYVNGIMLKGANTKLGNTALFDIEQDFTPKENAYAIPKGLQKKLTEHKLATVFKQLTPYRQREILRYLNYLKTEEALNRNIEKVINSLKNK